MPENNKNNIIQFPITSQTPLFNNSEISKMNFDGAVAFVDNSVHGIKNLNNKVTNLEKLRIIEFLLKDLISGEKYGISEEKKREFCKMVSIAVQDLEKSIDTE